MPIIRNVLSLSSLGLLVSAVAFAEQPPVTQLPTIEVNATKVDADKEDTRSFAEKNNLPVISEAVTQKEIAITNNVTDVEDAIKYLPSMMVRKRYVGDNNSPMAWRTSGTSSSARGLIYADGVLLSSLLGNNNTNTGSPLWNLVSPSEIDRIDVMYGPFSAAYSGNSIGGVVNITTRMPTKFEANASMQATFQDFDFYGKQNTYTAQQFSANIGDRMGDFSWRFDATHLDSQAPPIAYATLPQSTTPITAKSSLADRRLPVVTGAIADKNPTNANIQVLGETAQYHTIQDNFKWKLAYDITPTISAAYTLGLWQNDQSGSIHNWLSNANGVPIYSGNVNIGGYKYTIPANAFASSNWQQMRWSHGMVLKSNTGGIFDWEIIGSVVNWGEDTQRAPTATYSGFLAPNGAGTINRADETGWQTVDAKGVWRPESPWGPHTVSFGYHHNLYELNNPVYNTYQWFVGPPQTLNSQAHGKTQADSFWLQDAWYFHPAWTFTLGGRLENWLAFNGVNSATVGNSLSTIYQKDRNDLQFSPKADLNWKPTDRWEFSASIARAVRFPTVTELYQSTSTAVGVPTAFNPNPNLKPEDALSSQLTAQYTLDEGKLRLSLFQERVKDAIYSQLSTYRNSSGAFISTVQNIDQIESYGLEFSGQKQNLGFNGLDLSANATWVHSTITKDNAFPAAVGKAQPRVPEVRVNASLAYRVNEQFSSSISTRYSSTQWGQLDNSDNNHFTYIGLGSFFLVDTRLRYQISKQFTAAFGVDNLTNEKYYLFHPFPQRTYIAELKFSY